MPITKFYGGFNPAWRAGRLEREIVDSVADQINTQYFNSNCIVAVPSWHEPTDLIQDISKLNPDLTVICSLSDPLGPIENLLETLPGRVVKFGYIDAGIPFDFWAMMCHYFFRKYTLEELEPADFKHVFVNYNRKPHRHRIELIKMFELENLIQYGVVTLGDSDYTVNDTIEDYLNYGSSDIVGDVGIPNDIFSLGRMDIWNSHFLNIVSETQYEYSANVFLSEKIYKPIIGLRPFVINGSPNIYRWLKETGFDCFDDIFPVNELSMNNATGFKFKNHAIICQVVRDLCHSDLAELYKKILPRLIYNRNLFYEYAASIRFDIKFNI
jgi:hypothetical protein